MILRPPKSTLLYTLLPYMTLFRSAASRILLESGWAGALEFKAVCGGEVLPRELAASLLSRCAQLWNMYGPTETAIWSTAHRVVDADATIPIGRPIMRSEEHTSELQSLMRISYAVF